jgi:hypothetical protein
MTKVGTLPNRSKFRFLCPWVALILLLLECHTPPSVMGFLSPPSCQGRHMDPIGLDYLRLWYINYHGSSGSDRRGDDCIDQGRDSAVGRLQQVPQFPRRRTRGMDLSYLFQSRTEQRGRRRRRGPFHRPTIILQYLIFTWRQVRQQIRQLIHRTTVYVLECEHGKYYVGSTRNRRQRFRQHFERGRSGSRWTRLHRPKRVLAEYRRIPERYLLGVESQVTAEMMMKYGVNNVRGSYFTHTYDYTLEDLPALTGFLGHYNGLSYQHLSNELQRTLPPPDAAGLESVLLSGYGSGQDGASPTLDVLSGRYYETALARRRKSSPRRRQQPVDKSNDVCYRCGERGHWAAECPTRNLGGIEN